MKAIILAAGRGSRMGRGTEENPKCLSKLFGKTLLELELESIRKAGIEEVAIVRGYKREKIDVGGATYFDNEDWSRTNMVRSLCRAKEWLAADDCIISYSDVVYEKEAVTLLLGQKGEIVVPYYTNWLELWKKRFENPLDDLETFRTDGAGRIVEIGNKANGLDEIRGQYMGLIKTSPKGWKTMEGFIHSLPKEQADQLDVTSLLSKLIGEGVDIYGVPYGGLWLEADNENDLALYERLGWNTGGDLFSCL